jgi:1-acyl-sn-glycerol-3-phosphate acyltransferase
MKGLKLFWVLWRVVLYFNGHSHIGDVSFLVLSILTESGYPYFLRWLVFGQNSFFWYGFYYKIDKDQEMQYQKSYMIANHTSMADIMLMLAITGILLFVGKRAFKNSFVWFSTKEPASWLTEVLQK